MSDYVAWSTTPLGGFATFLTVDGFDDGYLLSEGVSCAEGWPSDASFAMDPQHKRDSRLADAVTTLGGSGVPVLSPALREALEAFGLGAVEFLPVRLIDRKGAVVADDYVIANVLEVIDALDREAMEITWNELDPTCIQMCAGVVLRAEALEHGPVWFRPKHFPQRVLVRRDVAEALEAFTGVCFEELEEVVD